MLTHRQHRDHERGAILVHVAFAILALLAFSTFVIDYGVFWLSRRQSQNAADAGALAAAIALAYDDYADRTATGPAQDAAVSTALANLVFGAPPSVLHDTDVTFPPCPDDGTDGCVRVDVYRTVARNNPLPVFAGVFVGLTDQDVRATATAKAAAANATECMKPIGLPAPLPTADGELLDIDDITLAEVGTIIHLRDTNVGQSGGGGGPSPGPSPYGPGWFQLLDFSTFGASPGSGAAAWRSSMISCPSTIGIGAEIPKQNGVIGQNVSDAVNMLYELDPDASWDDDAKKITDSCAEDRSCMRWEQTGPNQFTQVPDPGRTISPRVLPLAVFDMATYDPDGAAITVDRLVGFFLEEEMGGPPQFDLYGRLVGDIGVSDENSGGVPANAGFLKVIQLIR
jgi:Flp pilus assembly protein TadG